MTAKQVLKFLKTSASPQQKFLFRVCPVQQYCEVLLFSHAEFTWSPSNLLAAPAASRHLPVARPSPAHSVVRALAVRTECCAAIPQLDVARQALFIARDGICATRHEELRRLRARNHRRRQGIRQEHARRLREAAVHQALSGHGRHLLATGANCHNPEVTVGPSRKCAHSTQFS